MSESEERQSDLAVMEANEYKQKRRLRRILDVHDSVEDRANELFDLEVEGVITRDARNIGLMKAVQQFIRETWNLLMAYGEDLDEDEQHPYFNTPLGGIEFDEAEGGVRFVGLDDFVQANEIYTESWEEGVTTRHGPNQTETYSKQHTVPESCSWQAYLLLRRFLDEEQSLEIKFEDMEDGLPSWGFEEIDDPEIEDTAELARQEQAAQEAANGDD